jgi:solute carrier family 25 protein 16
MAYSCHKKGLVETFRTVRQETPALQIAFLPRSLLSLTNFYRGFLPTVYGMIPYAGASFLVYETIASHGLRHHPQLTHTHISGKPRSRPYFSLLNGAVAGVIAQTISYPLEIVRRRMQISGLFPEKNQLFNSTLRTAIYIWRTEGFRGFYIGLTIGYIKVVPMVATSFTVYEFMKHWLDIR